MTGGTAGRHRADIDGLRALAVMPIILFHLDVGALAGGFVGVDIFFVISGFLITRILAREIGSDRFSVADFYKRRAVRILPALLVMLVVVLITGCLTMWPNEMVATGESALAALFSASNVFFWWDTEYFASAADTKVLLHTWSLAVEEQFYLLYPALLVAVGKFAPGRLPVVLAAVVIVSFAIGAVLGGAAPSAAFYLLPSRAWELAIGGLAAVVPADRLGARNRRTIVALAGLALVIASLFVVRSHWRFPVPWAALPCVGAALVIAFGEGTPAGRLLSLAPLRWIGLISYSLYLWHWPLITFWRLEHGFALGAGEQIGLLIATLALGALSYRFVEQPFLRRYRHAAPRPVLWSASLAAAAVAAALALVVTDPPLWRSSDRHTLEVAAYADYRARADYAYQFRRGQCFTSASKGEAYRFDTCLDLSADKPNLVVLGDSHAAQYWRAIAEGLPRWNVLQGTASGCHPTLHGGGWPACRRVVDTVLGPLLSTGRVQTVILAARWRKADVAALAETIARIRQAGAQAIVVGPTIEYEAEVPSLLARLMADGRTADLASLRVADRSALDRAVAKAAHGAGATYVSALAIECPAEGCRTFAPDGAPMQFDYGHLTLSGARWVVAGMNLPRVLRPA